MSSQVSAESSGNDNPGVCCFAFIGTDSLRLINLPSGLLMRFQEAVIISWHKGIQRLSYDHEQNCYQVKLCGNPWWTYSQGKETGMMHTSRLLLGLSRFMLSEGWVSELSMTNPLTFQDSWYFTKAKGGTERHPAMCCIAFSKNNKIRVLDGCSEVLEAVESSITHHWPRGLQEQKSYDGTQEFRLSGKPSWRGINYKDIVQADILRSQLMLALKNVGWIIFLTVDFREYQGDNSVSRWILKKVTDSVTNR